MTYFKSLNDLMYKLKYLIMLIVMGIYLFGALPTTFALSVTSSETPAPTTSNPIPADQPSILNEVRKALVIGNSDYAEVPPLINPQNDADDMAAALKRLGFQVTLLKDVGRRQIESAVLEFSQGINDKTVALFYYAGHGIQLDGRNYLIPTDARLNDTQDLGFEVVAVDAIVKEITSHKPYLSLFILDACRDNPILERLASSDPGRTARIYRGLARSEALAQDGTLIAFATAENQVAADGTGRNSPYTTALLKWLETPDLELTMMLRKVRETVRQSTQGLQIPWETGAVNKAFYFNPRSLFSVPTAPRTRVGEDDIETGGQGGSQAGSLVESTLAWKAIQTIQSPLPKRMALEEFIQKYPDSPYKFVAQVQLQDLYMRTGGVPGIVPGQFPGMVPGAIPGAVPGVIPGQQPGMLPGVMPGVPGPIPGQVPGQMPGQIPGQISGQIPGGQISAQVMPGQPAVPGQAPAAPGTATVSATVAPAPGAPPGAAPAAVSVQAAKEPVPAELSEPAPTGLLAEFACRLDKQTRIQVQEALSILGYFKEVTNGNFGPSTFGAIYAYQVDRGMETTGYLTAQQLIVLFAEAAKNLKDNPDAIHKAKKENAPEWYVAIAPNGTLGYVYGIKGDPQAACAVPAPADKVIVPFSPTDKVAVQKVQQQIQKGGIPLTPVTSYDPCLPSWAVPPPPSPLVEGKIVYQVVLNGNVRCSPFVYAKEVGSISAGQWVIVLGRLPDGFWYQIESPNNEVGYVEARHLARPVPKGD